MFILSIILSIIKWGFWPWALNNSFSDNHVDLQIFGQLHVLSCLKIIHSKTFEQTVHQYCSMFHFHSIFPFPFFQHYWDYTETFSSNSNPRPTIISFLLANCCFNYCIQCSMFFSSVGTNGKIWSNTQYRIYSDFWKYVEYRIPLNIFSFSFDLIIV